MWISGLEAVKRKIGHFAGLRLSATPFFLRGSGYIEGTLFPWTMSDFSLMDAIESGIVKLPRVPVADNVPGGDTPKFRILWDEIKKSPQAFQKRAVGVGKGIRSACPSACAPVGPRCPLWALRKDVQSLGGGGHRSPAGFHRRLQQYVDSELLYKYVSGFHRQNDDGSTTLENGRLALFRNYDDYGNRIPRPNTILIDSAQLESGEALDKDFREMAADEIERFRREMIERTRDAQAGDKIDEPRCFAR